MNPSRYNGASLLGLRGLVLKSHGSADAYSFECAIRRAYNASKHDVLLHISSTISALLPQCEVIPNSENSINVTEKIEQKTA
jgi:glycerol-3-phosphate acyltransferase PlsX